MTTPLPPEITVAIDALADPLILDELGTHRLKNRRERSAARARLEALIAGLVTERDDARAVLRSVQWAMKPDSVGWMPALACPICDGSGSHKPDCALAAALEPRPKTGA